MSGASSAVRRVLARDDLLMMAYDADRAVGIVRQREALSRLTKDEKSLFSVALEHYLAVAGSDEGPALTAQAWKYAGVIVRFGEMVRIPVQMPEGVSYTAEELFALSLSELDDAVDPEAPPFDLTLHAFHRYRAARDLRLTDRIGDALGLSWVSPDALNGSGAEPLMAHLNFEVGAAHIVSGQAGQVEGFLREADGYWTGTRAAGYPTRYRVDLIRALAQWETGHADAAANLDTALRRISGEAAPDDRGPDADRYYDEPVADRSIERLSVLMATAEYLAGPGRDHARAAALGQQALRIADEVRGRWRVIARSRAPLAVVFQRVYGDIALLAAGLGGPDAAELGLRVALSAKQTGFAARIRTGRALLSPQVESIIDSIVAVEDGPRSGLAGHGRPPASLEDLHFELEQAVSPMLADTVLPTTADLADLRRVIGRRYALDYLELSDSLGTEPSLFRTLVRPGDRIRFEKFTPDPRHAQLFARARDHGNLDAELHRALPADPEAASRDLSAPVDHGEEPDAAGWFDWRVLGDSVLPDELRADLAEAGDRPIELLISAHSWLSLLPWPALTVADAGGGAVRLIQRAIVTQTPVLTCLQHEEPPPVAGRALIRLVGTDEDGVDVTAERAAWGLGEVSAGVQLSDCPIAGGEVPRRRRDSLVEAMREDGRWGFVHIAAHGGGVGLAQHLTIPGDQLSFGRSLGLKWPGSVLMASCHVGRVINVAEAEPLNLVMALLSGGARCVVAGLTAVDDQGTGAAAGQIVRAVRGGPVRLDVALREAQLTAVARRRPEREWALLAAYTQ